MTFNPRTNFKEKIDMSHIWLQHVNRTNLSAASMEEVYNSYVRQQLRLLPSNMQAWVIDNKDEYTNLVETFVFKSPTGIQLGTIEDPLLRNPDKPVKRVQGEIDWTDPNIAGSINEGDEEYPNETPILYDPSKPVKRHPGEIDWSDPNIISPRLEIVEEIDYETFNLYIMAAAEKAGLSWNVEMTTQDFGDVPESKKKRAPIPTTKTHIGTTLPVIPLGYDSRIISTIPGTDYNIINWHETQIIQGLGYSPIFLDLIQARTKKGNGTIIGTGGSPGDGKTWFCMRLGQILNRIKPSRHFNPYTQIPFTQEHFLWLISDESPLKQGDVIILDEAHFAAGARNWFKEDQKELVDLIASARNMGLIVILVVLHMDMLDKILRQFTMAFYVHLESPGKAIAYKTYTPRFSPEMIKNRIGPVKMLVPDVNKCDHPECLKCKHCFPSKKNILCNTSRAIYERRKKHFQNLKIKASRDRRDKIEKQNTSTTDMLETLKNYHHELRLTSHGNVDHTIIQIILERELGVEIGKTKSRDIAKRYKTLNKGLEYQTIP